MKSGRGQPHSKTCRSRRVPNIAKRLGMRLPSTAFLRREATPVSLAPNTHYSLLNPSSLSLPLPFPLTLSTSTPPLCRVPDASDPGSAIPAASHHSLRSHGPNPPDRPAETNK